MKEFLSFCAKHCHFKVNGETNIQIDGVAMR